MRAGPLCAAPPRARRAAGALAALLLAAGCAREAPPAAPPTPAERVAHYAAALRQHPTNWAARARLGLAQLDRARETLDPVDLAAARASLAGALEQQLCYEGLKGQAAAAAFAHRFEQALDWLAQAAAADPDDPELVALEVEARLGLGQLEAACAAAEAAPAQTFHAACARGAVRVARGELQAAAAEFERAARDAEARGVPSLARWARVRAAGVFLDAGQAEPAAARLAAVAAEAPGDRGLRTHQAELLELEGAREAALGAFEALLAERDEAELRLRAHALARALGDAPRATAHFAAAERMLRPALEAGEVYTLGMLARLLADAGVRLEESLALARRNLEHVRDGGARELLARLEALAADPR